MTTEELLQIRLENQGLRKPKFSTSAEVVRKSCAIQAQDYLGSLWSIGQRISNSVEGDIERSIANREIVRTWPMRGTLHFVSAEDVRWMQSLLTPRVITRSRSLYTQEGLDPKTLNKSKRIIERALEKNGQLTRAEIYAVLQDQKIAVTGQRGLHIINFAAQEQLICLGPRLGKQHTFVLLDQWVPHSRILSLEESLAELASRYLDSHSPATVHDFSWWSGLTIAEAKRGVQMIIDELSAVRVGNQEYWLKRSSFKKSGSLNVSLLSWFDEFIIAYKDRSATFDPATKKYIEKPKNGIYSSVILINGKISGRWSRSFVKNGVQVDVEPFRKFSPAESNAVDKAVEKYRSFVKLSNGRTHSTSL